MINAEKNGKTLNVIVRQHTLKSCMPEYEIIRILGILIDNALEAVDAPGSATLSLDSSQNQIIISTMNKGPVLSSDLRRNMFTYGYTVYSWTSTHILPVFYAYLWSACYSSTFQKSLMVAK